MTDIAVYSLPMLVVFAIPWLWLELIVANVGEGLDEGETERQKLY